MRAESSFFFRIDPSFEQAGLHTFAACQNCDQVVLDCHVPHLDLLHFGSITSFINSAEVHLKKTHLCNSKKSRDS